MKAFINMGNERLKDRENQPDQAVVQRAIGKEVLPVWESVTAYLKAQFSGYDSEWIYYNPQHGWAIRWRKESQQLCMLFPERGAFTALIMLRPAEEDQVLEKINFFNARIRGLLSRPSTLPQGRWLWIRLEDYTDFVGLKLILELKQT